MVTSSQSLSAVHNLAIHVCVRGKSAHVYWHKYARAAENTNASHDMVSGVKVCFSCALCDTWEMKLIVATTLPVSALRQSTLLLQIAFLLWRSQCGPIMVGQSLWIEFSWLTELVLAECLYTYTCNVIKSRLCSSSSIDVSNKKKNANSCLVVKGESFEHSQQVFG